MKPETIDPAVLSRLPAKHILGIFGERLAADFLERAGLTVIDRNWRGESGEIDLVALEADELVFVEVKTRSSLRLGDPLEAIDERKLQRLRRLSFEWCRANSARARGLRPRIDAVGVLVVGNQTLVDHIRGAA